jgi:hypothetical protein
MSYRINWYSIDKTIEVDWNNAYKYTIEEYGSKLIFSDCATDLIESIYNKNDFIPLRDERFNNGDCNAFILSKEGLLYIINGAINIVNNTLESGLKDKDDEHYNMFATPDYLIKQDIIEMSFNLYNVNDNKDDYQLTKSWQWRYGIFNLIYLYKVFDWDKNNLVLIGS